jgi:actin related protein 2/3 complex subunit 2
MAMILLKPGNRCLGETVSDLITWQPNPDSKIQTRRPLRVTLWDFDSVSFSVRVDLGDESNMYVSMNLPFLDDVREHGAQDVLDTEYEGLVQEECEDNYNITLKIDFNDYQDEEDQKVLIEKLEMFKPIVVGGVFMKFINAAHEGTTPEPFMFDIRPDTQVYFSPGANRVVVTFGIDFAEKVDKVIAKVFMQEFVDERKKNRDLGAAPGCSFSSDPPRELHQFGVTEATGNLGFISIPILASHVNTAAKRRTVCDVLQSFRTYLQYHLKCSKSYFHSRMRKKVEELKPVLNRAKMKAPGSKAKTVSTKSKPGKKKRSRRNF